MIAPNKPFDNTWSRWFFVALILFLLYLAYHLIEPFLTPVFLAVVLVVVAGPLYERALGWVGGRRALASAVACLIIIFIGAVPFFLVISVITGQALDLYTTVSQLLVSDQLQDTFREGLGRLGPLMAELESKLGITQAEVLQEVAGLIRQVSNLLYANLTGLLKGVTNILIGLALVLFVTFYMLQDGAKLARWVSSLSPLPTELNQSIIADMLTSLRATLKGSVVLAVIYGAVSGLGFFLFGVPNALFWGTVMVFASVVPMVGTALVWVPGGIYLIVLGQTGQALGVMIYCLVVMIFCDNWLRPKLIGSQARLHPLLTFFAVLGGITYFGMVGLILGPLVLAILLSLIEVYQRYFLTQAPELICPPSAPEQETASSEPKEDA